MASVQWIKHLRTQKERDDFNAILANSTTVLNRLKDILMEEIEELDKAESSISDFESPAWTHKQAYRNGDRARLRKVLDLIDIRKK